VALSTAADAIDLTCDAPQIQSAFVIPNNDSIFVDGNSLKVIPEKAKGDAAALIRKLDAKDLSLGSGVIIFRSGDRLYMVETPPVEGSRNDYGSRDYGSRDYGNRNDNGSDRLTINDPEYAQYKLKKILEENWTAVDSKTAGDTK